MTVDSGEEDAMPDDEEVAEFGDRIADYLTEHRGYAEMSKREAVVEAVRLVMVDARLESRRLLAPAGPAYLYKVQAHGLKQGRDGLYHDAEIVLLQDGGNTSVYLRENQVVQLVADAAATLRTLAASREARAARLPVIGREATVVIGGEGTDG